MTLTRLIRRHTCKVFPFLGDGPSREFLRDSGQKKFPAGRHDQGGDFFSKISIFLRDNDCILRKNAAPKRKPWNVAAFQGRNGLGKSKPPETCSAGRLQSLNTLLVIPSLQKSNHRFRKEVAVCRPRGVPLWPSSSIRKMGSSSASSY